MANNRITINFTPCVDTPSDGYRLVYRPISGGAFRIWPSNFTSSPIEIIDTIDPPGTQYEGYIQADCGTSGFGGQIEFETTSQGGGGSSPGGSEPGPGESESFEGFFAEFDFTPLDDDYPRPYAGSFKWNENTGAQIVSGVEAPLCYYRRFTPMDFGNSASGVYNWTKFDDRVKEAINAGQTFAYGIMTLYPDPDLGGFNLINEDYTGFDDAISGSNTGHSALPSWLLDTIQKFVGPSGDWCMNYRDAGYLAYLNDLHADIVAHINATSYVAEAGPHDGETVEFADVIEFVDVRGIGSYGEIHHGNFLNPGQSIGDVFPAGFFPDVATWQAIIDSHVDHFTDWPLCIIFNIFDHELFDNTEVPDEIGEYALTVQNNWGPLGYRNDHFGDWDPDDVDNYDNRIQQDHPSHSAEIMSRYLTSPIIFEPPGYSSGGTAICGHHMCIADEQVAFYHYAYGGNGNYGGSPAGDTITTMQSAFKAAGHIIRPTDGYVNLTPTELIISMDIENFGSAPPYDNSFQCEFELRSAGVPVWDNNGSFNPFRFWGSDTFVDTFDRPLLADGVYQLHIILEDGRGNYRAPFPFGIEGRQADGSYLLADVEFVTI